VQALLNGKGFWINRGQTINANRHIPVPAVLYTAKRRLNAQPPFSNELFILLFYETRGLFCLPCRQYDYINS
jgi:hypothetical protein